MELPVNAKIECIDGYFGQSTRVVVNPGNNAVTYIVVKRDKSEQQYLVGVDQIAQSDDKNITLKLTQAQVTTMPPFNDVQYILPGVHDRSFDHDRLGTVGYLLLLPYTIPKAHPRHRIETEHVPHGELAISRGHAVAAVDGHIGHVAEFLVHPKNHHISHIIIRRGGLWGEDEIAIPVSTIERIEAGRVMLRMDKAALQAQPAIPVKRWWN